MSTDNPPVMEIPLTRDEAWTIIHALANANRHEESRFEKARRSWIAGRIATAIDQLGLQKDNS